MRLTGRRLALKIRNIAAVEPDPAFIRVLEAGEHPQQGGLAASGGPEQGEELAFKKRERDGIDRRYLAEPLGDPVELYDRCRAHSPVIAPLFTRCDRNTSVKLTNMTMVAMALISGVTPKRIME